jgi:tetratricopeptide (TPR) repeat protein
VPAQNYRDRQTITPIELVSTIISNQISEFERRNRFSESVPLAIDRSALLTGIEHNVSVRTETAAPFFANPRLDLMNRLFNYGAFLLNSNREEECLRWIAYAEPRYPDDNRWQEMTLAAINNRITRYVRSGNVTGARNFLAAQGTVLNTVNYAQLDALLLDTEILNSANRIRGVADGDNVTGAIEEARESGRISGERASELLNFAIQRTAVAISAGRDWLAAINYIEGAIAHHGSTRELEQALRNFRANRATDFHNRFAEAWNRRNFDEAERILNEGLAEFPNDRQLLANREVVNRHRP